MNTACRKFLAIQIVGAALVNGVLNGFGPWFFFGYLKMSSVPMYGTPGILGDIIGTVFLLPFFVCITLMLETYRRMRQGLRLGHGLPEQFPPTTRDALRMAVARAGRWAVLSTVVLAPLLIAPLLLAGVSEVGLLSFCVAKAIGTAVLAAAIVRPIVLRTLADRAPLEVAVP